MFFDNLWPKYRREGDILSKDSKDKATRQTVTGYYVFADCTTGFMILIGVFFPSATGLLWVLIGFSDVSISLFRDVTRAEHISIRRVSFGGQRGNFDSLRATSWV